MTAAAGIANATISSTPVSNQLASTGGMVFAKDRGQATRRAFCELPLLVVF